MIRARVKLRENISAHRVNGPGALGRSNPWCTCAKRGFDLPKRGQELVPTTRDPYDSPDTATHAVVRVVEMMSFNSARAGLGRLRRDLDWMWGLRGLRPRVLWFHWRARRQAWRTNDLFSLASVTRPADMRLLLKMTRGRRRVVELGTATAWTAITLALDDRQRRVVSYDVIEREEAKRFLDLVGPDVRERIELVVAPGCTGPRDQQPVDLLYIDSSHTREHTIAEVQAWQPYPARRERRCSSMTSPIRTIQGCAKLSRSCTPRRGARHALHTPTQQHDRGIGRSRRA